jgi:hypothetical protein
MLKYSIATLSFLVIFASCEEIGPAIDFTPVDESLLDTTYIISPAEAPQQKVVLFEDFTGVQCVNCPTAHEETEALLAAYPEQLVVVAEHNYFAGPFLESLEDYEIPESSDISDYIGPPPGWPAGFVDRKDFGTGVLYTLLVSNYETYVEEQLPVVPTCNVYVENEFDADTRVAKVRVTVSYTTTEVIENHLSVMILENDIIDLQQTLTGIDYFYTHNHVLRDMFTPATGSILAGDKSAGRVFVKEFSMVLPDHWKEESLDIVAFVHRFSAEDKLVLQTAIAPL